MSYHWSTHQLTEYFAGERRVFSPDAVASDSTSASRLGGP